MLRRSATRVRMLLLAGALGFGLAGMAQGQQPPPQKSLFPQGPCGGLLCDSIGGCQAAPTPAYPPPPCAGLLCAINPYGMGVPVTAGEAARIQAERTEAEGAQQAAAAPGAETRAASTPKRHRRKPRRTSAKTE